METPERVRGGPVCYRTAPSEVASEAPLSLWLFGTIVAVPYSMSSKQKSRKTSTKSSKGAARKPRAARAAVANRVHAAPRAANHATAALQALPTRATRLVKSHPVRVLLGAAAVGLAVATLKNLV